MVRTHKHMKDPLNDLIAAVELEERHERRKSNFHAPSKPVSAKKFESPRIPSRRKVGFRTQENVKSHGPEINGNSPKFRKEKENNQSVKIHRKSMNERFHLAYTGDGGAVKDEKQELIDSLKRNVQHLSNSLAKYRRQDDLVKSELKAKNELCKHLEGRCKQLEDNLKAARPKTSNSGIDGSTGGGASPYSKQWAFAISRASSASPSRKQKAEKEKSSTTENMERELQTAKDELFEKTKRVSDLQANNQRLINELAKAEKSEAQVRAEMDERWATIDQLEKNKENQAIKIQQLEQDARIQALPIRTLEADKATLTQQVEGLKRRLTTEREKFNNLKYKMDLEREGGRKRAEEIELDLQEATKRLESMREIHIELEKKSADQRTLISKLQDAENARIKMEEQLQVAQEEVTTVSASLKEYKEKHKTAELGRQDTLKRADTLSKELEEEKAKAIRFKNSLDERNILVSKFDQMESDLKNQMTQVERKFFAHKRDASVQRKLLETKEEEMKELQERSLTQVEVRKLHATKEELITAINKILKTEEASEASYSCQRCLDVLRTPMTLVPCGHTFCAKCIDPAPIRADTLWIQKCQACFVEVQATVRNAPLETLCSKFTYRKLALNSAKIMAEGLKTVTSSLRSSRKDLSDDNSSISDAPLFGDVSGRRSKTAPERRVSRLSTSLWEEPALERRSSRLSTSMWEEKNARQSLPKSSVINSLENGTNVSSSSDSFPKTQMSMSATETDSKKDLPSSFEKILTDSDSLSLLSSNESQGTGNGSVPQKIPIHISSNIA